jgi:hypothetical protein
MDEPAARHVDVIDEPLLSENTGRPQQRVPSTAAPMRNSRATARTPAWPGV